MKGGDASLKKYVLYVLIICFIPTTVLAADNKEEPDPHPVLNCEHVNEEVKDYLTELLTLFQADDADKIKQRINQLMQSEEDIQTEKIMVSLASCYTRIDDDTELKGMFELYASFLTYVEKAQAKKQNEQVESFTIKQDELKSLYQLDAVFTESEDSLHIDHFYSWDAYSNSLQVDIEKHAKEKREMEENELGFIESIVSGISNQSYQFFQNPIEKVLAITDERGKEKIEQQHESYKDEARQPSGKYRFAVSMIGVNTGTKSQEFMTEYYPTHNTYGILERLENVHDVLPEIEYPRELVEQQKWMELISELNRIEGETGIDYHEVWNYINIGPQFKNISEEEFLEQLGDKF